MGKTTNCDITLVGTRRDGGKRYWCLKHRADATAKYGRRATTCRYAHIPPISSSEILKLNPNRYQGGVGIWGAAPAIYDTTLLPLEHGVHVHARHRDGGKKAIDATYRGVQLLLSKRASDTPAVEISELDAIYFMVGSVFGYEMRFVECTFCKFPHLDKDWFSVHAHRTHLCSGCGKLFRDEVRGIGNPAVKIRSAFDHSHRLQPSQQSCDIRQSDYPGGIQIWGSNPALLWTANRDEEEGIHIHAFDQDGTTFLIDDTYSEVTIDNVRLDPKLVRVMMAQSALPYISGRVMDIFCQTCGTAHFDEGELALTPHNDHCCKSCGAKLRATGRLRKTVANPMYGVLDQLAVLAVREPQRHKPYLLTEI
ncbi:MAG: hypothetical protein ACR2HX_11140 [Pyrinomonadaceae bacterium]